MCATQVVLVVNNLPANAEDTGSIPGPRGSHMPRGNNLPANAGDTRDAGSIPGSGRIPGGGNGGAWGTPTAIDFLTTNKIIFLYLLKTQDSFLSQRLFQKYYMSQLDYY